MASHHAPDSESANLNGGPSPSLGRALGGRHWHGYGGAVPVTRTRGSFNFILLALVTSADLRGRGWTPVPDSHRGFRALGTAASGPEGHRPSQAPSQAVIRPEYPRRPGVLPPGVDPATGRSHGEGPTLTPTRCWQPLCLLEIRFTR
jgi:hypothetical protein